MCVCVSSESNEDVSPRQGLSPHSSSAVHIQPHLPTSLNIVPKPHSPSPPSVCIRSYLPCQFICLPVFFRPALSLSLHKHLSLSLFVLLHPSILVLTLLWPGPNGLKMLLQVICIYLHLKCEHGQENLGGKCGPHIAWQEVAGWGLSRVVVLLGRAYRKQIHSKKRSNVANVSWKSNFSCFLLCNYLDAFRRQVISTRHD